MNRRILKEHTHGILVLATSTLQCVCAYNLTFIRFKKKRLICEIVREIICSNNFSFRIGLSIGKKPWIWLLVSFIINCICSPGMIFWKEEVDDLELCVPVNSEVRADAIWVQKHFRDDLRYESIIITAPNILEPEVLQSVYKKDL